MGILRSIFPGLSDFSMGGVPNWGDGEPWDIFHDTEDSLRSQILAISEIVDGIFIHPSAMIGENVVIQGPSYIGPNTEIRSGALIREGSWICEGAIVGHCSEVKNSVLLPNAKAPHFNYVGDSIVGFEVNLGAGVKLSNVRNDRCEISLRIMDDTRIPSGLRKLGALVGDGSQIGCNVVTNPGAIISPGSMIPPNETITGWFGN